MTRDVFCLLPEDKKSEGRIPRLSIREDATIAILLLFRARNRVQVETTWVFECR
jgi:hypothetical protein